MGSMLIKEAVWVRQACQPSKENREGGGLAWDGDAPERVGAVTRGAGK